MKGARKLLQEAKAEFQSVYNELEEQDERFPPTAASMFVKFKRNL